MAKVNICDVTVLDNPSPFRNPFQFEITFECLEDLKDDLEWRILYVGSAESEEHDQVLDTVLVGPLVSGRHKFVFQADAPDISRIPVQDAIGVTVVLLTCGYRSQEFIRVGYYVNNEYSDPELKENPPGNPEFDKVTRNILATCPRVTRFRIDWNDSPDGTSASGDAAPEGDSGSENKPPPGAFDSESNQMGMDLGGVGGGGDSMHSLNKENSNSVPSGGVMSNGLSALSNNLASDSTNAAANQKLNGNSMDASGGGGGGAPFAQKDTNVTSAPVASSDSRDEPAAMEM